MEGHPNGGNGVWMNIPVLLIMVVISTHQGSLWAVAQKEGFLSIDCGSLELGNYTDPSYGIQWAPDALIWPDIGKWSSIATVSPPSSMDNQKQYTTLRYFPPNKALNQSKFCYTLPAIGGNFYLIRASFWYDSTLIYATHVSGQIRFRVIVDTYEGVEIVINIPQSNPWFEEMYIPAQSGKSSVSVCLSAASDSSDVPFINSLEMRPLPLTMNCVEMMKNFNYALRTVRREDSGTSSAVPPILRYPDDTIDRFWWRGVDSPDSVEVSNQAVQVDAAYAPDLPPVAVMQTNYVSGKSGYNFNISSKRMLSTSTLIGTHYYYIVFWFAELNPNVTAPGQRVFNVTGNDDLYYRAMDIYGSVGSYKATGLYTEKPVGPYKDSIIIKSHPSPSSTYGPTLAAAEIMQLFENSINATTPTSDDDRLAIQDIIASTLPTLQNLIGDPCLPQAYKHPWIDCDYSNKLHPARVTSLLLSNYSLAGTIPSSISNLDQLATLDLSNNKFSGTIPDSLSYLSKLTYLNLANNNFSGTIPQALLQKQGLKFRYEGNNFLCIPNDATCLSPQPSPKQTKNNIALIIGASVGAILFVIIIIVAILCIVKRRKNSEHVTNQSQLVQPTTHKYQDPHVNVDEKVLITKEDLIDATNIAQQFTFQEIAVATNNFSMILGQGGFGLVYKGNLTNGLDVAVKILSHTSQQGSQEFLNEVSLLSRVHHKNLVGFVGYSIEKSLVLVYEFMSNGSLHDALSRRKASRMLTWPQRLQILSDAAQGLAYLHDGCNITHRDVKSSNILLSSNLEGKMSDFGISKFTSNDTSNATRIFGTMGYLDPEYASTLRLTQKVDVYSFGVVILEAICGKMPIISKDANLKNVHILITEWVRPSFEQGMIQEVVDKRLKNEYNLSSMWKVAEIAMACVQREGIKRPTMYNVCNELREAIIMESNHEASPIVTGEFSSIHSNVQAR